jgi:hypothetical protein
MGVERASEATDGRDEATDGRGASTDRRGASPGDRGVATAAIIVFAGLFMLMLILGGGFLMIAMDDGGATDPTELSLSTIQCEVVATEDDAGVGNATFALRYRGSGDVDLSDATIDYIDEEHEATYRIGANDSNRTIRVRNETGAHDPTITTGVDYSITVPVLDARGAPLPADATATVELNVQGTAIIDLIRTPGAIGSDTEYVAC